MQDQGVESFTQAFGRAAFDVGLNGLLVPSAKVQNGINVVYFPEKCSHSTEAKVWESEKLNQIRGK